MAQHLYKQAGFFYTESGERIKNLELSYHTYGQLNAAKNNVVWVCHALTANADVLDWWAGLFGEDDFFSPKDYFIVCVNIPGSCYGSTGPLSGEKPLFERFPTLSIRDIVNALEILRNHLKIKNIHTIIGASLGGQQALEWSIKKPRIFQHLILLATNARHSPWGIAFNESQRLVIGNDPVYQERDLSRPSEGLKAARSIAMLSYRSYEGYGATQKDGEDDFEDLRAASYQRYQGAKLAQRFNPWSYYKLSQAMDSHNVGRKRGGMKTALSAVKAKTLVIGVSSDVLFPVSEQQFLANNIVGAQFRQIDSLFGHDGFLIETGQLTEHIANFLNENK
jgi:homoserine O-acetyltransferase